MGLKFHCRGTGLVSVPFERRQQGVRARYVGRDAVITDGVCAFPASRNPYECANAEEEQRLVRMTVQDACLWPADAETAAACGLPFTPIEWRAGEWVPAAPSKAAKATKD